MNSLFYDHLIVWDDLIVEISGFVPADEHDELIAHIDEFFHIRVLERILDLLPREHHQLFLDRFYAAPADVTHLKFLQQRIDIDISAELVLLGEKLRSEVRSEFGKHHLKKKPAKKKKK